MKIKTSKLDKRFSSFSCGAFVLEAMRRKREAENPPIIWDALRIFKGRLVK